MHPKHIHPKCEHPNQETGSSAPPDDRRADQIVLGLPVAPPAHPQAEPHQRPICRRGREDVFFVRGDERIVRRHHCDAQSPKVAQERRTVALGLAQWYWGVTQVSTTLCETGQEGDAQRSFQ